MKRFIYLLVYVLICALFAQTAYASELDEYKNRVYSDIQSISLPDASNEIGIDLEDPESLIELDDQTVFDYVVSLLRSAMLAPFKIFLVTVALSLVLQIISSLSDNSQEYETMIVIVCFISISGIVIKSFSVCIASLEAVQVFMASYVPIFASVTIASGNIAGAISYNSIVLYTCEILTLFATVVLKPILICITILSVTQAINSDFPNFTGSLKKAFTTVIGLFMTIFTGIIGIKTVLGRAADSLGLRAGKYLITSFIPVLGYTITSSLDTIKTSLSAIRSTIGIFGIVIAALIFITPLITVCVYRFIFTVCECTASLCQCNGISKLMKGLSDVYSLLCVIMIMYLMMLIISTGMLISYGGSL